MKDRSSTDGIRDVPPVVWLGLPLLSLGICLLSPLLGYSRWNSFMAGEMGFIEQATVVFLLPAIVLAFLVFRRRRELPRGVGWVILLAGIAAFYFAGEEISWGQHYIGFRTPEPIARINLRGELNLHNIRGFNIGNNVPRQLMLLACLVGGVILPLVLRRRMRGARDQSSIWYWLIPTVRLVPVSLLAVFSTIPEKLFRASAPLMPERSYLSMAFVTRSGEFKEYCFALVMLLYVLSVYLRMRPGPAGAARPVRLRRGVPRACIGSPARRSEVPDE